MHFKDNENKDTTQQNLNPSQESVGQNLTPPASQGSVVKPESPATENTKKPKKSKESGFVKILGISFLTSLISSFIFFSLFVVAFIYIFNIDWQNLPNLNLNERQNDQVKTSEIVRETTNLQIINEDSELIETVQRTNDSVVSIVITRNVGQIEGLFGFGTSSNTANPTQVGAGTGFIVSEQGHIITNRHVVNVENASYTVVFNDGKTVEAEILDKDRVLDIAVLQVQVEDRELIPLQIGDSNNIRVGQTVLAIGNSLGRFGNSVSRGIVSGLNRNVLATDGRGGTTEMLNNVIQTDASINPGNSGGPLLDVLGNVIGVNVARAEADNVAFAIPINDVKIILESVIEKGSIQRPFIGIRYREITPEIAQRNNLKVDYGVVIISQDNQPAVTPNSPADKAGLKTNDIILKINDQRVDMLNPIPSILGNYRVGDEIILTVLRGEDEIKIKLVLGLFDSN